MWYSEMIMDKNLAVRYLKTFVFSFVILLFISAYSTYYHGYMSLRIFNKITADAAILLLGTVLLIGPLTRVFSIFDHYILYRKELGVVAFFYALVHGILSLRMLSISYYLSHLSTFIPGVSSLLILLILYVLSFEHIIAHINRNKWWHIQNWGVRIAALLGLIHFVLMKYGQWASWYVNGGTDAILRSYLPSTSLLVASFGLFVLIIRLVELSNAKRNSVIILWLSVLFVVFLGGTFGWGIALKNSIPSLTWQSCILQRESMIRETYPSICAMPDGRTVTQIVRE